MTLLVPVLILGGCCIMMKGDIVVRTISRTFGVLLIASFFFFNINVNGARALSFQTSLRTQARQFQQKRLSRTELDNAVSNLKLDLPMTKYNPTILYQSETNWTVRMEPNPQDGYELPFWARVLFCDFSKHRFRTIVVGANQDAHYLSE